MVSRTLSQSYEVAVPVEVAWDYLSDPVAVSAQSTHRTWVEKPDHGFAVGTDWIEHHTDDCGSEPVRWVVRAVDAPHRIQIEGLQSGARQRSTTTLQATPLGTEVTNVLEITTTWRSRATVVERILLPVMLATGFGVALLAEGFEESVADDQRYLAAVADGSRRP